MHYALDVRRYNNNNNIAGYYNDVFITMTVRKLQRLIILYYYYCLIVYRAIPRCREPAIIIINIVRRKFDFRLMGFSVTKSLTIFIIVHYYPSTFGISSSCSDDYAVALYGFRFRIYSLDERGFKTMVADGIIQTPEVHDR